MKYLYLLLVLVIPSFCHADIAPQTDKAVAAAVNKTSQAVGQIVNQSIAFVNQTKDFVKEQAPEFIQEYLHYHLVISLVYNSIGLFLLISACYLLYLTLRGKFEDSEGYKLGIITTYIILALLFSIVILCVNLSDSFYIILAPRVYLVEHLPEFFRNIVNPQQ